MLLKEVTITKNSLLVLALFAITIVFQVSALKWIWSLEKFSRLINILTIITGLIISFKALYGTNYSLKVWKNYLIPGMLVFGGMFLNIVLNTFSNFNLISVFGITVPWIIYLIIPYFLELGVINTKVLWNYFFYFMLIFNLLGIFGYYFVFFGNSNLRPIITPHGEFLANFFSIYFQQTDGDVHFRYYSCFLEPGTLAMFLLPAIAYAFFYKKFLSLTILLIAFYLTFSLGGIISLLLMVAIFVFIIFNRNNKYFFVSIFVLLLTVSLLWVNFSGYILEEYDEKDNSAKVREESFANTLANLPVIIISNPLGLNIGETSEDMEKNRLYSGTNFLPGFYLQYGGILAFFGYLAVLVISFNISIRALARSDLTLEEKVVFSSILGLLPFIFQRSTIWESALFAFLFAPFIIAELKRH
jgi:hypothetical protein